MEISIDDLQAILKIFRDSDLEQMYIEIGDLKFEISKAGGVISSAPVRKAQRSAGRRPRRCSLSSRAKQKSRPRCNQLFLGLVSGLALSRLTRRPSVCSAAGPRQIRSRSYRSGGRSAPGTRSASSK